MILRAKNGVDLSPEQMDAIIDQVMQVAKNRGM